MAYKYLDTNGLTALWSKIKAYVSNRLPTKTSDLTNDSGYVTDSDVFSGAGVNSQSMINGTYTSGDLFNVPRSGWLVCRVQSNGQDNLNAFAEIHNVNGAILAAGWSGYLTGSLTVSAFVSPGDYKFKYLRSDFISIYLYS